MRKIFGYIIAVIIVASLFAAMAYQGIRTRNFEKQLFSAARSGDQKEIGYLISHRTPLNIVDERGYTPLLVAVSGAKYFAAEALFRGGALRNIKTPDGKSVVDLTLESTAPVVKKAKMLCNT